MVSGFWFIWCMVYGLCFMVYGLWFVVCNMWFMVYSLGSRGTHREAGVLPEIARGVSDRRRGQERPDGLRRKHARPGRGHDRALNLGFVVGGWGLGVWGLGFGVWGLGFGVWGSRFGDWGLGGCGLWFVVSGLGFRFRVEGVVCGLGCRV
jgi:hypothetical protein